MIGYNFNVPVIEYDNLGYAAGSADNDYFKI